MKPLDRLIHIRRLINAADENELTLAALRSAVASHIQKNATKGEVVNFARAIERYLGKMGEKK